VMAKKITIGFFGNLSSTFVKNDYDILRKHFEVLLVEPPKKKKLKWINYIFTVKNVINKSDVIFCWFAGWHSAFAVHFAKMYDKFSYIVIGGYDAAYVPEIGYGAFTNIKEKIPAKYVLKNADLLLPVSQFTSDEIRNKITSKGIKLIYNGVDTNVFKPDGEKESNLILTVGFVNWDNISRKGIETFVKAAKYLPDLRFVIIGKHLDKSIDYLKSIGTKNVVFTGFVSHEELLQWYQKATVICQLSYYEAFGIAPVEGMACGCIPVVTKERSGMPEFIGDYGFYVPFGDEKATAEAIKKAVDNQEIFSDKIRERITKMFSLQIRENQLIDMIKNR
jgi:glycosyltransferase involved in cell wall biosynthesis